jgi:hypothetical protein
MGILITLLLRWGAIEMAAGVALIIVAYAILRKKCDQDEGSALNVHKHSAISRGFAVQRKATNEMILTEHTRKGRVVGFKSARDHEGSCYTMFVPFFFEKHFAHAY